MMMFSFQLCRKSVCVCVRERERERALLEFIQPQVMMMRIFAGRSGFRPELQNAIAKFVAQADAQKEEIFGRTERHVLQQFSLQDPQTLCRQG